MDLHALNQTAAAELLGTTTRSIRAWEKAGSGVPRNRDGTYNAPALVAWFVDRKRAEDDELDPEQERARKDKETADKLAMENAVRRGELAELGAVEHSWSDLVLAFRAKMLSMPTKLGPQLINVTSPALIASRIAEEINVALRELGAGREEPRDRRPQAAAAPRRRARRAAAKSNGQSVGRRSPTTQ